MNHSNSNTKRIRSKNSNSKTKKNNSISHSPRSRSQLTYEFNPSLSRMNVLLDGSVVGSVTFKINNDIFNIDTIFVESECRGCGIGKFILKNIK